MNLNLTGKTIAKLRKSAGFTQASLAEKLGVSDKAVSKWERGIACPDTSVWNQLSILLDTDIESLLYGYDSAEYWIGVLVLNPLVNSATTIYNKPMIDYLLSQFLLVGIREIVIVGECYPIDVDGVSISITNVLNHRFTKNAFIIYGNRFIYGPNLTKHFKRAMSRGSVTVIAAMKAKGDYGLAVDSDKNAVLSDESGINKYYALPYVFAPKNSLINEFSSLIGNKVCVETMVRGMVCFDIKTPDDIYQMSGFVKMMEENTGEKIADLQEIVKRRMIKG